MEDRELTEADREALELMNKLLGKVEVAKSFGRMILRPVTSRVARAKKVASAAALSAMHVAKQRAEEAARAAAEQPAEEPRAEAAE